MQLATAPPGAGHATALRVLLRVRHLLTADGMQRAILSMQGLSPFAMLQTRPRHLTQAHPGA